MSEWERRIEAGLCVGCGLERHVGRTCSGLTTEQSVDALRRLGAVWTGEGSKSWAYRRRSRA